MKSYRVIIVLLMSLAVITGCNDTKDNPVIPPGGKPGSGNLSILEKSVVSSDNSFGLKLFSRINTSEQNKNVFISPFSVSMALGMALNGADGSTLDSMKQVLEHSGFTMQEINESYKNISEILTHLDSKVVFQIANSIWYRNGFLVMPAFLNNCQDYFDAEAASLDFNSLSAVQTINDWVNSKTNGKISKILDQIPSQTVMYLINAIYFKGAWTYQFDPAKTTDATFTTSMGSAVTCRMMNQKAVYAYNAANQAQIIDLPYGNRLFSMTIILPAIGTNIDQFAAGLTQQQYEALLSSLDSTEVEFSMPKFKVEYEKQLKDELSAMGMGIAFSDYADFSRIANAPLTISEVKHKTFVEVNEEGTVAAAVTSIGISLTAMPSYPIMRVDRPFIFVIREHASGTILFIGKIVNLVAS
jgi:serine protease inhibitor